MAVILTTGNKVLDHSFESGSLAAVQVSWLLTLGASEFSVDAVDFHDGLYSLKCTTVRTGVGWNSSEANLGRIPCSPSTAYNYRGWVKQTAGAKQTHFKVEYYQVDGTTISAIHGADFIAGGTDGVLPWTKWEATYTSPADAAFLRVLPMYGYWDGVTGSNAQIWFDGVQAGYVDQSAKIRARSMTCKLNTLDLELVDPDVIPILGDDVTLVDGTLAWEGRVAGQSTDDLVGRVVGKQIVGVSATNELAGLASAAPFNLTDTPSLVRAFSSPGFETPTTDWVLGGVGSGLATIDATNPHTGSNALKLTNPSQGNYGTAFNKQGLRVGGLTNLTVKAWLKGSVAGLFSDASGGIRITFANAGPLISKQGVASAQPSAQAGIAAVDYTPSITTGFVEYTTVVTVPAGYVWAFVEVYSNGNGTVPTTYVDDLSVTATAPTQKQYARLKVRVQQNNDDTVRVSGTARLHVAGLWPAMTFKLSSVNQQIAGQDFSVRNVTVTWPTKAHPVFDVDFGDPIVTMSVWVRSEATDEILPITETKITDGAVSTPKLAANAVSADKIAAGAITADKLTAIMVLASMIQGGAGPARTEMDENGFRAYNSADDLVVNIPTYDAPVTVNANLIAQLLEVIGNAVLRGTLNELSLSAILQLAGQVNDPSQPPALATSWPSSVALPIDGTYDISGSQYSRLGAHYDSAGGAGGATKVWLQATKKANGSHEYLLEIATATGLVNRALDLGVGGTDGVNPLSVCRLGSYIYVLSADKSAGSGGSANLGQTGGVSGDYAIGFSGGPNEWGMGTYAMPEHGTLKSITVDCGANSGTVATRAVLWNSAGTILAQGSDKTLGVGHSPQTWTMSAVDLPAGTSYFIGIFQANSAAKRVGVKSSGSLKYKANQGSPSAFTGTTNWGAPDAGDMQAYLTYDKVTAVTTYRVRRYLQSTLALDTTYDAAVSWPIATPVSPVMCSDGTNLFVVDKPAAAGTIKWNKYDGDMVKVGSTIDTSYSSGSGDVVSACAAGSFDLGAFRVACATINGVETFDSAGARQANELFPVSGARAYGLGYGDALGDGARFWSLPPTGGGQVSMTRHTTWVWTTASPVYWAGYTWYDDVGTTHETKVSPRASITMGRRQALGITSLMWPGSGGADEPDSYNAYLYNGASDPGAGGLKRQATSQTSLTYTAEGYNSGGTADPGSNNYPAGSAAQIKSQTGGLLLKGDGKARFNNDMPRYENNQVLSSQALTIGSSPGHHLGMGSSIAVTPSVTGRVRLIFHYDVSNNTAGKTTFTNVRYGTGTAPAADAAATGSSPDGTPADRVLGFTSGTFTYGDAIVVVVTGLSLGTAYWFDLIGWMNGGTTTWSRVSVIAEEY